MTHLHRAPQYITVYRNVTEHFIPFRGMTIASEPLGKSSPPAMDNLTSVFKSQGFWRINAATPTGTVVIIILSTNYPWRDKATFAQFMRGTATNVPAAAPLEKVLLIGDPQLKTKKNLMGVIPEIEAGIGAPVRVYSYECFAFNLPEHPLVYPHRVMGAEETAELLKFHCTEAKAFPKIRAHSDPAAIWYGITPGDMVEIRYRSENAIEEIIYLYAVA